MTNDSVGKQKKELTQNPYISRMENTGRTTEDLKFEYQVSHSQYSLYFNAILIIVSVSIVITSYIIANLDSIEIDNGSMYLCMGSSSLGCIIGVSFCLYNAWWKTKHIGPMLEKYSIYSESKRTAEKRQFDYFRSLYVSLMQLGYEKNAAARTFMQCSSLFAVSFISLIIGSIVKIEPFWIAIVCYVCLIIKVIWDKMALKKYSIFIVRHSILFIDAVNNVFYEERFENLRETMEFSLLVSRKRRTPKIVMDSVMKNLEKYQAREKKKKAKKAAKHRPS